MSKFSHRGFKERLSRLMAEKHLTQEELGESIHFSRQTIGHCMNGKSTPNAEMLFAIAEEFGCSVDYLLGRTTARVPEKAIAMDELQLSETAVAVVHGESPHLRGVLQSLAEQRPDEAEESLRRLSDSQPVIHETIAALLEKPEFERAMRQIHVACEFESLSYQAKLVKNMVDGLLQGDESVSMLPDGRYSVSKKELVHAKKASALNELSKAIESVIESQKASTNSSD